MSLKLHQTYYSTFIVESLGTLCTRQPCIVTSGVYFVQDNLALLPLGTHSYETTLHYYLWVRFVQDNLALLPLGTLCTRQPCNITSGYSVQDNLAILPLGTLCARQPCSITSGYSLCKTILQYYLWVLFVQDNLAILPLGTLCTRQPCNITSGYAL